MYIVHQKQPVNQVQFNDTNKHILQTEVAASSQLKIVRPRLFPPSLTLRVLTIELVSLYSLTIQKYNRITSHQNQFIYDMTGYWLTG